MEQLLAHSVLVRACTHIIATSSYVLYVLALTNFLLVV